MFPASFHAKQNKMEKYFTKEGNLVKGWEEYFAEDESLKHEICHFLFYHLQENNYPSDSELIKLYHSQTFADQTHGNYTAKLLYQRAKK